MRKSLAVIFVIFARHSDDTFLILLRDGCEVVSLLIEDRLVGFFGDTEGMCGGCCLHKLSMHGLVCLRVRIRIIVYFVFFATFLDAFPIGRKSFCFLRIFDMMARHILKVAR